MARVKVLIVDDKDAILSSIKNALLVSDEHSYEIETAKTVETALNVVETFNPHVCVVDNFLEGEGPTGSGRPEQGSGFRELVPRLAARSGLGEDLKPLVVGYSAHFAESDDPTAWGVFEFVNKSGPDGVRKICEAVARAYAKWEGTYGDDL